MNKKTQGSVALSLASAALAVSLAWATAAGASDWPPSQPDVKPDPDATTLTTNVSIFNGTDETLINGRDVVVKGNVIDSIVDAGGDTSAYGTVIDGQGGYGIPASIHIAATEGDELVVYHIRS